MRRDHMFDVAVQCLEEEMSAYRSKWAVRLVHDQTIGLRSRLETLIDRAGLECHGIYLVRPCASCSGFYCV